MSIKEKWKALETSKKIMIGVGSVIAVAAVGTGAVIGVTASQPAQKVAETTTETHKTTSDFNATEMDKKDPIKDDVKEVAKADEEKDKKETEDKNKEKENDKDEKKNDKKETVTTKTITSTETIKYKTIKQNDSSLEKGKTKVAQKGQNGTRTVTYKVTYKNGKEVSKEQVSSKVTKKAVDEIIKVGTKEAPKKPKYLSASEAHNILAGSGMTRKGNNYYLSINSNAPVTVEVGGNHVKRITFNADQYIPWKVEKLSDLEAIIGDKAEAKKEYDWGKQQVKKIEKAVRAAANAVYGPGTSQANSLYNEIINSKGFARNF